MRVLDTNTGQFSDIDPTKETYAILSHTWDLKGEQTYQELREIQELYTPTRRPGRGLSREDQILLASLRELHQERSSSNPQDTLTKSLPTSIWDDDELSRKIWEACRVAREDGYRYLWIDSCCIDKDSSSELSESINSMYQWYAYAGVCYAFLSDVVAEEDHQREGSKFRCSRWFTRGWTLQELIAPRDVQFFSMDWRPIGSKDSLVDAVVERTHIQVSALLHLEPLDEFSVAQRFSWATGRETTRAEDRAYSLLGIFDINMRTLYGEHERAFRRLQEEIMRRNPDQSLFAWTDPKASDPWSQIPNSISIGTYGPNTEVTLLHTLPTGTPFLAPSPDFFKYCTDIKALSHDEVARRLQLDPKDLPTIDYDFTPHGIRTRLPVISITDYFSSARILRGGPVDIPLSQWYLVILGCGHKNFLRNLLGRVCAIQSLGSGVKFIHRCQSLYISDHGEFDLLPLSSTNTSRPHLSQISIETLHIPLTPFNWVQLGANNTNTGQKRQQTIKLVLPEKTPGALSAQGYGITLRSPDDTHPNTHTVTLSHTTHIVTIDYRHTLPVAEREYLSNTAQELMIEANVTIAGPAGPQDPHGDHGLAAHMSSSQVALGQQWPYWSKEYSFGPEIVLNLPSDPTTSLTLRHGLTFITTDHYFLRIELETDNSQSPDHGSLVLADANGSRTQPSLASYYWGEESGEEMQMEGSVVAGDTRTSYLTPGVNCEEEQSRREGSSLMKTRVVHFGDETPQEYEEEYEEDEGEDEEDEEEDEEEGLRRLWLSWPLSR